MRLREREDREITLLFPFAINHEAEAEIIVGCGSPFGL